MVLHQKLLPSHSSGTQCVKLCGPNCQAENLLGFVLSSDVTEMRNQKFELPVTNSLPSYFYSLHKWCNNLKIMIKLMLLLLLLAILWCLLLWGCSALNPTLWGTLKEVFVVCSERLKLKMSWNLLYVSGWESEDHPLFSHRFQTLWKQNNYGHLTMM